MAKLTKEQRDKLPAEDFGDPKKRLFPITDQDSLDAAARLHGHADDPIAVKAAIKAIADKKGLAVPDAWQDDEDDEGQGGKGKGADAEYEGDDAGMSAVFSLSSAAAANAPDGFVLRKAPVIFRAGDYPDKNFSMSPEEMLAAVASFSPVDIDLEHKPSVLDKKLGRIVKVELSADGTLMGGEALIPAWLDGVLDKDNRRLSAAFCRKTKKMIGCSLVRNPRVSDAALMAAFAASGLPMDGSVVAQVPGGPAAGSHADPDGKPEAGSETPAGSMGTWRGLMPKAAYEAIPDGSRTEDGQKALKSAHDASADAGACGSIDKQAQYEDKAGLTAEQNAAGRACFAAKKEARRRFLEATFASDPEAERLQAIHDMASQGGGHCASYEAAGSHASKESGPTYAGQRDDEGINDNKRLNQTPPKPAAAPVPLQQHEAKPAADSGTTPDTSGIVQGKEGRGRSPYEGFSAEQAAAFNQLQGQVARLQAEKVAAEAVNFADGEIAAKRSLPADRDGLIAAYTLAAQDDLRSGSAVNFDGQSLSRTEFLKRQHLKRLPHQLTAELVPTAAGTSIAGGHGSTVGFSGGPAAQPGQVSDERRKELLAHTALGRTILTKTQG